jgi:ketosteroid isomerase-like protein
MKSKALWLLLPLLLVVILVMTGCTNTVTTTATQTTTTTTTATKTVTDTTAIDVVNKFIKAEDLMFSTGDGSGLMDVEDANIVIHMMAWPDTKGSANHVAAIKGIRDAAAAPITHTWSEITGTGDIGSVRWTETDKVGGKDVTYQGAYFLKIKNGKIVEAWLISDMLTYFLAAGIVQYAPPPSK